MAAGCGKSSIRSCLHISIAHGFLVVSSIAKRSERVCMDDIAAVIAKHMA